MGLLPTFGGQCSSRPLAPNCCSIATSNVSIVSADRATLIPPPAVLRYGDASACAPDRASMARLERNGVPCCRYDCAALGEPDDRDCDAWRTAHPRMLADGGRKAACSSRVTHGCMARNAPGRRGKNCRGGLEAVSEAHARECAAVVPHRKTINQLNQTVCDPRPRHM